MAQSNIFYVILALLSISCNRLQFKNNMLYQEEQHRAERLSAFISTSTSYPGEDTPDYIEVIIKKFEELVKQNIPETKIFNKTFLPNIIFYIKLIHDLLRLHDKSCDYKSYNARHLDRGYALTPYFDAAYRFQQCIDMLFVKLEGRGYLQPYNPLCCRQKSLNTPFLSDVIEKIGVKETGGCLI